MEFTRFLVEHDYFNTIHSEYVYLGVELVDTLKHLTFDLQSCHRGWSDGLQTNAPDHQVFKFFGQPCADTSKRNGTIS